MSEDFGGLLERHGLDLLWVMGPSYECPDIYYLTGGASLTRAWVLLRRGRPHLLVHGAMERESARASALETVDFSVLGTEEIARGRSDPLEVELELFARLAEREGFRGRIAAAGVADPGFAHALLSRLGERLPQLTVVRDFPPLIQTARIIKRPLELELLREVAHRSLEALAAAFALIRSCHEEQGKVVDAEGRPLTIGRVRGVISGALALQGLEESHQTILSIGREAGIPHASSPADTVLATGKTMVIDLFPRRAGGGYYFDITRSFMIGRETPEGRQLWDQVLAAQQLALQSVEAGMPGGRLQELVCGYFEALGHPTLRSAPGAEAGYVHSLGHGIGLEVHEYPYLRLQQEPDPRNRLLPGTVFTLEPGLYYPERELGVRLEDVVWIDPAGRTQLLAPFEKPPVLELEG